jgi:hypothetical protein
VAGGPIKGAPEKETDRPNAVDDSETPTLVPAFDVATFARAAEAEVQEVAEAPNTIEAALVAVSEPNEAPPVVELGTAEVDLDSLFPPRLGSLSRVPIALPRPEAGVDMSANQQEGLLLGLVDGQLSLQAIVDASALPRGEALRMLSDLVERGILGFGDDTP